MTQYNFRTRLEPNLFSGHFDKAGTVLAIRYAHSSCARMTRGAKTGYTTGLTSVTSPNPRTTYRAYSTGFWHDFFRRFSFLAIFRVTGKNLCYQDSFWYKYGKNNVSHLLFRLFSSLHSLKYALIWDHLSKKKMRQTPSCLIIEKKKIFFTSVVSKRATYTKSMR